MTSRRSPLQTMRRLGLAVLAGGLLAAACSNHAGASAFVSGPVTLSAKSPANASTPWGSGQVIDITVAPNSTLSLKNLEHQGGFTGEPAMKAVECDDPGGSTANLPDDPTFHCDGSTILSTTYINADGSFRLDNYPVYALPDSVTLGESSDGKPICGTQSNQCVLYIGPNQEDFSKPHIFSAPFLVTANSNDKPSAAAAIPATSPGSAGAGIAATAGSHGGASADGSSGGTLAFTGPFPDTFLLIILGALMVVVGTAGRRTLRPREAA
jgi:hypothetical protein